MTAHLNHTQIVTVPSSLTRPPPCKAPFDFPSMLPLSLLLSAEKNYTGSSAGTIAGIMIGVLILLALGTSLGYFLYRRRTWRYDGISFTRILPRPKADPITPQARKGGPSLMLGWLSVVSRISPGRFLTPSLQLLPH